MLVKAHLFAFWDFRAEGVDNVPLQGGAILACTHQSHLDPVLVTAPLPRRVGYVARSTLFGNRWFAALIGHLGALAFDRESTGTDDLRLVIDELEGGRALVFFPEGTRSPDGEIGRLKPGIAILARRARVPVVPVAIEGTFRCWPRHRKVFRPGKVRVLYGEPVEYGPDVRRKRILTDLAGRLAELRGRALDMT
jgi:1-acyl-sn-glycerol-3-phosphate acyltransferase